MYFYDLIIGYFRKRGKPNLWDKMSGVAYDFSIVGTGMKNRGVDLSEQTKL